MFSLLVKYQIPIPNILCGEVLYMGQPMARLNNQTMASSCFFKNSTKLASRMPHRPNYASGGFSLLPHTHVRPPWAPWWIVFPKGKSITPHGVKHLIR